MIRRRVRTAGPTIKGIPMGTTPIVSFGNVRVFSGKIISTIEIIKRRIPPAIWKSETAIPNKAKTDFPAPRNPMLARKPVRIDWRITLFRSDCAISDVRETKIGRIPKTLNATKRGIKGKKILREINCVKIWWKPSTKIAYKKKRLWTRKILLHSIHAFSMQDS